MLTSKMFTAEIHNWSVQINAALMNL